MLFEQTCIIFYVYIYVLIEAVYFYMDYKESSYSV